MMKNIICFFVVRAMPCFTRGVFRVSKNEMRKTIKPPARQVVEHDKNYRYRFVDSRRRNYICGRFRKRTVSIMINK